MNIDIFFYLELFDGIKEIVFISILKSFIFE